MKIFIGYEEKYPVSYEVCKASITRFTDEHDIQPLDKKKLQESKDYWRPFKVKLQTLPLLVFSCRISVIIKTMLLFVMEILCGDVTHKKSKTLLNRVLNLQVCG